MKIKHEVGNHPNGVNKLHVLDMPKILAIVRRMANNKEFVPEISSVTSVQVPFSVKDGDYDDYTINLTYTQGESEWDADEIITYVENLPSFIKALQVLQAEIEKMNK